MVFIQFDIYPVKQPTLFFDHFSDDALSVESYEYNPRDDVFDVDTWGIKLLFPNNIDVDEVFKNILTLACTLDDVPQIDVQTIEDRDWVGFVHENSKPIQAGPFFIYGSHHKDSDIPADSIPLLVDAATAFGSGEHETTFGCLLAISKLTKNHTFDLPIDVGCGSGILSIALAKILKTTIMAVDCDPESVLVTTQNAERNQCQDHVKAWASHGFDDVPKNMSFDLVVANILANPLIQMAADVNQFAKSGAFIVLSGLLTRQRQMVADAYTNFADVAFVESKNGWDVLVLKKRLMASST